MTCGDGGAGLLGGEPVFCVSKWVKKEECTSEESSVLRVVLGVGF
jgi:hypothetical protein